jgi:hypothetical protein
MFKGSTAQEALTELNARIGHPVRALKVQITPLSLSIQAQDPAKPDHVDEYQFEHIYAFHNRYHETRLTGPTAVQLDLINNNLAENLFDLADVNIAGISSIAAEAVKHCALQDGGAVTEINIQRQLFLLPKAHNSDVQWDISVKTDREYANAYADAKGKLTRLNLDGTNRAKNLDLFADAKELQNVVAMVRNVFGTSRGITQLHLEKNYLWFSAREPARPSKLGDYTANLNGVLLRGDSLSNLARKPFENDMFFAVDDANWSGVPDLLKQAQEKLQIAGGSIYKVSLNKTTITGDPIPLTWDIEVLDASSDHDEGGEVEFDAKGTVTRTRLPKSRRGAVNLFEPEALGQAVAEIAKKFASRAQFMEMMIEEHRIILVARNPKDNSRLRDFIYDEDHFSDFPGSDRTPFYRDFQDDWLFELDQTGSALLPRLAALEKATLDRLKLSNGKIERVTISKQKNIQHDNTKVLIEIRALGDSDKGGWVNYDLAGKTVSVMTP